MRAKIDNMELVVKDDKYIQYEKNGMFKLNDNYKKGKCSFPVGKCSFPLGKLSFPIGRISFPTGKYGFPQGK